MIAMSPPPPPLASHGCCLAAVVRETRAHGWPHPITGAEAAALTRAVFRAQGLQAGRGLCHFRQTIVLGWCGIVPANRRPYRVNFRVFEDGAWKSRRVAP